MTSGGGEHPLPRRRPPHPHDDRPASSRHLPAIGDPATLASALQIPGGVFSNLRDAGASGDLEQRQLVRIDAVVPGPAAPRLPGAPQ
jgi:hypothetical protein